MIEVELNQIGSARPGHDASRHCFNRETFRAETLADALRTLSERYGITPPKRPRGIYVDAPDGPRQVGFSVSRWNSDVSHPGKPWWEENWITFTLYDERPLELPPELKARGL